MPEYDPEEDEAKYAPDHKQEKCLFFHGACSEEVRDQQIDAEEDHDDHACVSADPFFFVIADGGKSG